MEIRLDMDGTGYRKGRRWRELEEYAVAACCLQARAMASGRVGLRGVREECDKPGSGHLGRAIGHSGGILPAGGCRLRREAGANTCGDKEVR